MKHLIYITLLFISFSIYAQNRNFTYDNLGRLTQIQYANGSVVQYSYDANGNRLQHIVSNIAANIDLSLSGLIIAPTTISAGNATTINLVNNNAGTSACGGQNVTAYLSTDNVLSANDVLLNTYYVSSISASGNVAISNWAVTIPSTTIAGAYNIILKTDANNIITETNENNNTISNAITITSCPIISVTESITSATCGIANGLVSLASSGGALPYQFSINNGANFQSSNTFSNLASGTYTCISKDANNCTGSKVVTVTTSGGNLAIPNFTYTMNGQTLSLTNTSQFATNYTWDFGDGNFSSASNPTHTYASSGVYNVCLTANNNCGSNQYCENLNVGTNYVVPSEFPKMFWNNSNEVSCNEIAKSFDNNGWVLSMSLIYNVFGGSYTNYFGKLTKIDSVGNIIWNKDFEIISQIVKCDTFYAILHGSTKISLVNDNGNVINTIQTVNPISNITSYQNKLSWLERISANNAYLIDSFKIKTVDVNNPSVVLIQKNIAINYYTIWGAKIKAFSNGKLYFTATYENTSYNPSPINHIVWAYSQSGNYLTSWQYQYQNTKVVDIDEDANGNIVLSLDRIYTNTNYQKTIKLNPVNGAIIGFCDLNGYIKSNGSSYFFKQNNSTIKTDLNFQSPVQTKYFNNYFGNSAICDIENNTNFLLSTNPCPFWYGEGFNVISKLTSDFKTTDSCKTDSVFTYNISNTISPIFSYFNWSDNSIIEPHNLITYNSVSGVISDSNECYIPPCNVSASFSKSKATACLGDVVTFTNTSTNGPVLLWKVNGVSSGNTSSIQKTFSSVGTYTIQLIASDYGNCLDTSEYFYTIAPTNVLSTTVTNMTCGQNDGSIIVNTSGGVSPFSYSINNGIYQIGNNWFSNLSTGIYTIGVKDANNCMTNTIVSIIENPNTNLQLISASNIPNCSSICNGTAVISASGGNSPYSFGCSPAIVQNYTGYLSSLCPNTIYTITVNDATGCTMTKALSVIPECNVFLNLTAYIQGYYLINTNSLQPVLSNQGLSSSPFYCDTIKVELHNESFPYNVSQTFQGILSTNGTLNCVFPASVIGNSFYIVLKHRNSIETWSANPILFSTITNYNFTSSASKAYGNNEYELNSSGIFSIYNGDATQDGSIDIFDFLEWDYQNQGFSFGYANADFNGDGVVDIFDFLIWDPNNQNFIGAIAP